MNRIFAAKTKSIALPTLLMDGVNAVTAKSKMASKIIPKIAKYGIGAIRV